MSECGYKFTTLNGICGLTEGHDGPHQTEAEAKALAQDVAVELQARITELEDERIDPQHHSLVLFRAEKAEAELSHLVEALALAEAAAGTHLRVAEEYEFALRAIANYRGQPFGKEPPDRAMRKIARAALTDQSEGG